LHQAGVLIYHLLLKTAVRTVGPNQ